MLAIDPVFRRLGLLAVGDALVGGRHPIAKLPQRARIAERCSFRAAVRERRPIGHFCSTRPATFNQFTPGVGNRGSECSNKAIQHR
jgi:hypothetical protein